MNLKYVIISDNFLNLYPQMVTKKNELFELHGLVIRASLQFIKRFCLEASCFPMYLVVLVLTFINLSSKLCSI